ncbi:MAG: M56 family metallopeptidase [Bdellovibrionota bacterium]
MNALSFILDAVWKALVLSSVSSTLFFAAMLAAPFVARGASWRQIKWFYNAQELILALLLAGGSVLVISGSSRVVMRCLEISPHEGLATRALAAVWVIAVAALLSRDVWLAKKVHALSRTLAPLEDARVRAVFERLRSTLGIRGRVSLHGVDASLSPFAYGLFHHKVVLPRAMIEGSNDAVIAATLAHELVHVREKDSAWLFVEIVCRRLLFWHPLTYLVKRRYLRAVEKTADQQAVEAARVPVDALLSALVEVSGLAGISIRSPLQIRASEGFADLKERIEALTALPRPRAWAALPVLALLAILPAAGAVAEARVYVGTGQFHFDNQAMACLKVSQEEMLGFGSQKERTP